MTGNAVQHHDAATLYYAMGAIAVGAVLVFLSACSRHATRDYQELAAATAALGFVVFLVLGGIGVYQGWIG